MTTKMRLVAISEARAAEDAAASVARETDAHVRATRYTPCALEQMGWRRSYGADPTYRRAFTAAFVEAWSLRVRALEQAS